jgi:hypothetical protein
MLVSDPALADSLNKRTVGIRHLSDIYDLQRLKRQNELNRQLVAGQQAQLARFQAGAPTNAAQNGSELMPSVATTEGATADDRIQIGDTAYNINVQDPAQLREVLQKIQDIQHPPAQPPQNGGSTGQETDNATPTQSQDATTITAPSGTPVSVWPQPPMAQTVQVTPAPKTLTDKLLPWALVATTALAGAGIGYAIKPSPADTDTRYRLEFDETTEPEATIPTPRLNDEGPG